MRTPPRIALFLAVAAIAGLVVLWTAPRTEPDRARAGKEPEAKSGTSRSLPPPPDPTPTEFAASASEYHSNAPRRRDGSGRPLPFRQSPFDQSLAESLRQAQEGSLVSFELFHSLGLNARITGRGRKDGVETVSARFDGRPERDRMFLSWQGENARGLVLLPSENLAYEILGSEDRYTVREWLFGDAMCATPGLAGNSADSGLPRSERSAARNATASQITPAEVPALESLPGAPHVIYLDFDGETVTDSNWTDAGRSIIAAAARMTASQIRETWERVRRDFEPFAVNITTVRAVYDGAETTRKIHVVITPTDAAAPGAGGVAFLDSFRSGWPGDKICWSFEDYNAKDCAEVISHELGHAFGLSHDGRSNPAEEYYEGHGSGATGWAPIMGVGYYRQLTQWSKGEYARANNTEDDLAIIGSPWNLPRASDDHGSATWEATAVGGDRADGTVTSPSDDDFFSIVLGPGSHTVFLTPAAHGNVDLELEVRTAGGTVLATANPPEELSAAASFTLTSEQTVLLRVAGRGKPEPPATGYSSYGSLGSYFLTGFGNQEQPPSSPIGLTTTRLSGTQIRVGWNPNPTAQSYAVYRDGAFLAFVAGTEFLDTTVLPSTTYSYSVTAWNSFGEGNPSPPAVVDTPAVDEFIMDGQADFAGYLVADPGMTIYAAVRGTKLYVATWSPGDNSSGFGNDHFVFVSDTLLASASASAPWGKAGAVGIPGNRPYLAGESTGTYAAWHNTRGSTTLSKAPLNSGVLEGVIDLVAEFGTVPDQVYVAAVAYATRDAGGITGQAPSGNGNDNLEPNEFLRIPLKSVTDRKLDGVYDVLDPARSFNVTGTAFNTGGQPVLRWPVVPGRAYQVQSRMTLGGSTWQNLLGAPRTADSGQWEMEFTDTTAPAAAKFYRVTRP